MNVSALVGISIFPGDFVWCRQMATQKQEIILAIFFNKSLLYLVGFHEQGGAGDFL